jgi:hypothetical protein
MTDVVQQLWGFCHTLRHDGIDYGDYIEQLTYLLFLKMADAGLHGAQKDDTLQIGNIHTSGQQINCHDDSRRWAIAEFADMLKRTIYSARDFLSERVASTENVTSKVIAEARECLKMDSRIPFVTSRTGSVADGGSLLRRMDRFMQDGRIFLMNSC